MTRRLLAALLALLLILGVSGVARALSGESIECCCGRHDAHRACKCPACPVSKRRKHAATTRLDNGCDGNSEPGVLAVTAVAQPGLPSLLRPIAAPIPVAQIQPLFSRLVEAGRPPP